jgi:hypothetical protein
LSPQFTAGKNILINANDNIFVIDIAKRIIYKENSDGSFEEFAKGLPSGEYVDMTVCYDNYIYYLCILKKNADDTTYYDIDVY